MNDITQWIPVHGYGSKVVSAKQITTIEVLCTGERKEEFAHCLKATLTDGSKVDLFIGTVIQCKAAHDNFINHFGGKWTPFKQPESTWLKRRS